MFTHLYYLIFFCLHSISFAFFLKWKDLRLFFNINVQCCKFFCFNLFEQQSNWARERYQSPIHWFVPQRPVTSRLSQAKTKNAALHPILLQCGTDPRVWAITTTSWGVHWPEARLEASEFVVSCVSKISRWYFLHIISRLFYLTKLCLT